ncbi:MAG TPA: TlpA disulfide reductase family protein [Polyangium sp.]|jgi:thiol-disulfide isomerase/thioredoxin|nr:TlpA disulfide reductase family protein [Polyangium sp.]
MTDSDRSSETPSSSIFAVLLVVGAFVLVALLPKFKGSTSPLEGKTAPDATFSVAANGDAGSKVQVSGYKGHPVVLDFWATWCGPCTLQAPILDRIARRYEKQGLVVLGVNVDDPPEIARAHAKRQGLSYPIVMDTVRDGSRKYGVEKLPSLVVIDREGRVIKYMSGLVDEASLDEVISSTL